MGGRASRLITFIATGAAACGTVFGWWAIAPLEMTLRPLIGVLEWHALIVGIPSLMAIAAVRPDSKIFRPITVLGWALGAVLGNTLGLLYLEWPASLRPLFDQTEEWIITNPGALLAVMIVCWDADRALRLEMSRSPAGTARTILRCLLQCVAYFVITSLTQIACFLVVQRLLYPS